MLLPRRLRQYVVLKRQKKSNPQKVKILNLPPYKPESYKLRNVTALGLQKTSPQLLNVILYLVKTVKVRTRINVILRRPRLNIGAVKIKKYHLF
jgi:hypothetical protein